MTVRSGLSIDFRQPPLSISERSWRLGADTNDLDSTARIQTILAAQHGYKRSYRRSADRFSAGTNDPCGADCGLFSPPQGSIQRV